MKNLFKFLMSVAILFTASCAKEDISSSIVGNGEAVEVTFSANLADLGTRAYGKAEHITTLHYFVYDQNGTLLDFDGDGNSTTTIKANQPATVTLPLIKGMTYKLAFWADDNNGSCSIDGNVVTVNYGAANNDSLDAFYALIEEFDPAKADDQHKTSVTLYRPFAQLNALTNDAAAVALSGVDIKTSTVKVVAYTKFDVTTGDVVETSKATIEFNPAAIPTETLEGKETLKYLSMNYILVPKAGHVSNVEFTFTGSKNVTFKDTKYDNVPFKQNYRTNILGALLTKPTEFNVEIETDFNKPAEEVTVVNNAAELQAALDNAAAGATIHLQPNVNYGTVYLRPVAGAANTVTNCDYLVYRNEMLRKVENLTIIGAAGAKVEAIKVVAGYVKDSGSTGYVVDIKNLVIDGVEFNDTFTNAPHSYAAPIFFDLTYTNVNGLTVKNCKLIGNNDKMNFVYLYGSGNPSNSTFETAAKNITISNNVVDGIARLCELRQTENVTITNNIIKNTYLHGMLLPVDGGTYSGNVTITGNTAEGINDRFVRMAGAGDAVVVIKDNTIKNYLGADLDYIKVTDGSNVTIENNNFIVDNYATLEKAVAIEGANITVKAGSYSKEAGVGIAASWAKNVTLTCEDGVKFEGVSKLNINGSTFIGGEFVNPNGSIAVDQTINGTFKKCNFNDAEALRWCYAGETVVFEECIFGNNTCTRGVHFDGGENDVVFNKCTLYGFQAFGDALTKITFNECNFAKNSKYNVVNMYSVFEFNNCQFNPNMNCDCAGNGVIADFNNCVYTDGSDIKSLVRFDKDQSTCVVRFNGKLLAGCKPPYTYDESTKTYSVSTAEALVAISEISIAGNQKIVLTADIDLTGVEFNGLSAFNSENNNTFDGKGYTVSNWTNNSGASDMGFIRNWVGTIKNVNFENCHLKTGGRSAIAAAKVYGNIEHVSVNNCSIEDSFWACGLIAGLYNAGSISNCSATNSSVKSNGGTGGIVGVINESAGTRSLENCTVSGTTVNNTGVYGEGYSGALLCGMINISNSTVKFVGCSYENNTKEGNYVGDLYYAADDDITIVIEE